MNNRYFKQIVNKTAKGLENFDIVETAVKVSDEIKSTMRQSDGVTPIQADVYEVVLKRE